MIKLKELPDVQAGFFSINFNIFIGREYCFSIENILEKVELLVVGKYDKKITDVQFEIAESNSFVIDKVKKLNVFLDNVRKKAENKQYYELCYNISQVCGIISYALAMYQNVEIT